jgi:hypothetical protein
VQAQEPDSRPALSADLPTLLDPMLAPANGTSTPIAKPAEAMRRITGVAELTDVKPTDWAYQLLQSLIARYGVIVGYPDLSFRGNRAMTRYEFAAALAAALPEVDLSGYATKEDLEALKKLTDEFAAELAVVKGKLSNLERIEPVSTTTKFTGEVIFAVTGVAEAEKANDDNLTDSKLVFNSRAKLNFNANLGNRTLLQTTLKANNISGLQQATGTDMARLSFQGDSRSQLEIDEVNVRSRFSKQVQFQGFAVGGSLNKFTETLNPFLSSSGQGSISRFGQRNPIYRQGGGTGLGFSFNLSREISLDVGYLLDFGNDPDIGIGNAPYGAIAQLTFEFSKTTGLAFTYIRSFNSLDTNTGSARSGDPFDGRSEAITADSVGVQAAIGMNENLAFSAWAGFTRARATDLPGDPAASIFNWAVTLAAPNLGGEGNLLGLVVGQPPKVTANDFKVAGRSFRDDDTSLHLEAFYRIRVDKAISITPGFIIITNPEHDLANDSLFVGTIRTTFTF